jgi:hypothetical protein
MRRVLIGAAVALALLVEGAAVAQGVSTVQYAQPFRAQTLAGTVLAGLMGTPVKDVLVEECTPGWKVVESQTKTDDAGHFSLPGPARTQLYYLRLSANGFNTTLIKVRVSSKAHDKKLSLKIEVST